MLTKKLLASPYPSRSSRPKIANYLPPTANRAQLHAETGDVELWFRRTATGGPRNDILSLSPKEGAALPVKQRRSCFARRRPWLLRRKSRSLGLSS
jgi:hypothetical protein